MTSLIVFLAFSHMRILSVNLDLHAYNEYSFTFQREWPLARRRPGS